MCDMITSSITQARDAVWNAGETVVDFVVDSVSCWGRRFEDLTSKILPPAAARIFQRLVYSMPVTVAALTIPGYLVIPLIASYAIVHIGYKLADRDSPLFSQSFYDNLWTGLGTAFLYSAVRETAKFAMQEKASVLALGIDLLLAGFFYSKSLRNPLQGCGTGSIAQAPAPAAPVVAATPPPAVESSVSASVLPDVDTPRA